MRGRQDIAKKKMKVFENVTYKIPRTTLYLKQKIMRLCYPSATIIPQLGLSTPHFGLKDTVYMLF